MIQKRITSDIVERLLALHHPDASDGADEIERLRDLVDDLRRCLVDDQFEIEQLRIAYQQAMNTVEQVTVEIERLRANNDSLQRQLLDLAVQHGYW
jgi:uncharacterized coiled-coil DUF342 family protein